MRYEKAKGLKDTDFKRLCGVKKETFEKPGYYFNA